MSRLGSFGEIKNPENITKTESSIPMDADKRKLEPERNLSDESKGERRREALNPSAVKTMGDREKIAYYRKKGLDSLADNRNAILRKKDADSGKHRLTKVNSHNFDKLAQDRIQKGTWSPSKAKDIKESFPKWHPEAQNDPSLRNHSVLTRYAPKGERAKVTGNPPNEGISPSGDFVAKGLAKTPDERINHLALPPKDKEKGWDGNTAKIVSPVELAKSQNILVGPVAPQKEWETDGIPRNGGGRQIITDGGYKNGAIRNVEDNNPGKS